MTAIPKSRSTTARSIPELPQDRNPTTPTTAALAAAALALTLAPTRSTTAQPAGALTPPSLLEAAETPWPADEPARDTRVEVPCRVTLDDTGAVLDVQVLESQGAAFDTAAVAAIRASRFAPARQDDRPIPARFVFRWVFQPPPPPEPTPTPPPEPPPPVVTFEGQVLGENDTPLEGAVLSIEGETLDQPVLAFTSTLGDFFVFDLPPGAYQVRVSAPQFATLETREEILPDQVTLVVYRLQRAAAAFETVVRTRRPPREMTRQTIETREIVRMPGTGGDSLRVVENLPGVARPQFGAGLVVVRGSAPQNTAFYVDGIQVPLLYHFGALRSAVAADFLERIDYYPGNYSVRYGGVTAGIVDVAPRRPDRDAWNGYVDANLIDTGAFAEGPVAPNASIALGLRRSYIDAVLAAVQDMVPFDTLQAPVYWDFQALADWEPTPDDDLRFFAYGSDDRFSVLIDDLDAGGPTLVGERTLATSFYRFQAEWTRRLGRDLENRALLGAGYNEFLVRAGTSFDALQGFVPIQLRDELTWQAADTLQLTLGLDTTVTWNRTRFRIPDFFANSTGIRQSICALEPFEVVDSGWSWTPGLYAETELRPIPRLRLIPGLRIDLFDDGKKPALDPRLNVRYEVLDGTTLKAGLGQYSQPPPFFQTDPRTGNPDLDPEHAVHYGLGLEQRLWDRVRLQLDAFYREVGNAVVPSDRPVESDGRTRSIRFENTGRDRAYGLELLLRYEPDDLFFGWLALTLMQSEEWDPREGWRDAPFDQLLNLTLLGSFDLGAGWSVGLRFRLAQGYPTTPVAGAIYNADCDEFERIPGPDNSIRLPWFHQLDLRVDKKFEWRHFALDVYLDVQNVYYAENVEALGYNYDYTRRRDITGLPILPALGIKGEFH